MNYYAEREYEPLSILNKNCNIIGVYSPIKRSLKTSFCLTLGQILAKERAVLYINMEEYSGFSTIFQKEYKADLSDVIYYIRQDKSNILVKLEGIVDSVNNLDYIPPATSPMDIREVSKEDWQRLIHEINANSKYETIIIDFGDGVDGLIELLSECSQIYMPILEDYLSAAKIEQFEKLLNVAGYGELNLKIKKVKLPYHNSFGSRECYAEQLIWSELGDYVRQLAR
jgi:cellulose biosynthesis protein BcsQ